MYGSLPSSIFFPFLPFVLFSLFLAVCLSVCLSVSLSVSLSVCLSLCLSVSVDIRPGLKELKIELKYHEGQPVISEIKRVSRPGRRVYYGLRDLPRVYNGLGIAILSTPRGVLSDNEARTAKVGGEVLCHVF